jgi:hypothetical protein
MTKEQYFDMCEQLGTEPVEDQIPVEYEDLLLEVQEALRIYNVLQDNWDYMNGNYIGKNLNGFKDILEIFEIPREDYKSTYEIVVQIDRVRQRIIQSKKPKDQKPAK